MGPIGWATQFSKLCRGQFGVSANRIVSFRDILASYEAGEEPEDLLKKVLRYEVPKLVPISLPTGEPVYARKAPKSIQLSNKPTTFLLTSPELPLPVKIVSSSAKIEDVADKVSGNPKVKSFHIEEDI